MEDLIKRSDFFYVPFSKLRLEEGLNLPGRDKGIEELAESIYQNGAKVPLSGYKKDGFYIVTVGHRRFAAAELIKKMYKKNVIFKFFPLPQGTTKKDILFDHFLSNDGMPLSVLQKAFGVSKLIAEGVKPKEISEKLRMSEMYVSNLRLLADAPAQTHDLVDRDIISSTELIKLLKKKGNVLEMVNNLIAAAGTKDLIDSAIDDMKGKGNRKAKPAAKKKAAAPASKPKKKTAKLTSRDLNINSVKEMKGFIKKGGGEIVVKGKLAIYHFVADLLANKYDANDINKFFTE